MLVHPAEGAQVTNTDYTAIAEILVTHRNHAEIVSKFADLFSADNHNFSREKWFAACGVSDPTVGDKVNNLREQLGV